MLGAVVAFDFVKNRRPWKEFVWLSKIVRFNENDDPVVEIVLEKDAHPHFDVFADRRLVRVDVLEGENTLVESTYLLNFGLKEIIGRGLTKI